MPGWGDLRRFATLPSTQSAALEAGQAGAPEGTAFLAGTQTAGRGRHGHTWASPPGSGLYLSVVLRPRRATADLMLLTLAAGVAVADAVRETAGLEPEMRWPNDLLLGGRKFCGVLLEAAGDHAALGIGVNVAAAALPPEVASLATALNLHAAAPVAIEGLGAAVLAAVERRYRHWSAGPAGDAAFLAEFARRCPAVQGRAVTVGGEVRGVTAGLEPSGVLRVRLADGNIHRVLHGDVRPL